MSESEVHPNSKPEEITVQPAPRRAVLRPTAAEFDEALRKAAAETPKVTFRRSPFRNMRIRGGENYGK